MWSSWEKLAMGGGGEELVGEVGEDAQIAGGVLGEGGDELVGHQVGLAGLGEDVGEPVGELLG